MPSRSTASAGRSAEAQPPHDRGRARRGARLRPRELGQGQGDVLDRVALLDGHQHVRAGAVDGAQHRQRHLHRELQLDDPDITEV
jgi:hypothetical protein